uniref:Histone deacetylase domain-containing protein n=1 Tax=Ananas comosus var. bracteatus TaxID=296719 RepID=A0A6V7PNF4_ANACO|nr:unnamed protein product [Ananas comosus var. bracteatus]
MCGHATPDGESHPENPSASAPYGESSRPRGSRRGVFLVKAKEAEDQDIASVHSQNNIKLIRSISSKQFDSRRNKIAKRFNSIYFNEAEKVANGELNSAIALVRPPGHHAEHNEAMGFCLFNNVAIAVSFLLKEPELGIKKILIVDWDVHHGNGTQNTFYKDPHVLFFSVHRFDFGTFYPAGGDGSHCMVGEGPGQDYLAVWDHVLIPVAEAYNPDIVMISAGFDAGTAVLLLRFFKMADEVSLGDPLGGCCITPYGYSLLLKKLITFARGKIVMVLEGVENKLFESTWRVIQAVRDELKTYWPVLGGKLPEELLAHSRKLNLAELNFYSSSESDEEDLHEPSASLSRLNVDGLDHAKGTTSNHSATTKDLNDPLEASHNVTMKILDGCVPWRSALLETYIWYASYGSNMWRPRFLCYIEGGKNIDISLVSTGRRYESTMLWITG